MLYGSYRSGQYDMSMSHWSSGSAGSPCSCRYHTSWWARLNLECEASEAVCCVLVRAACGRVLCGSYRPKLYVSMSHCGQAAADSPCSCRYHVSWGTWLISQPVEWSSSCGASEAIILLSTALSLYYAATYCVLLVRCGREFVHECLRGGL